MNQGGPIHKVLPTRFGQNWSSPRKIACDFWSYY